MPEAVVYKKKKSKWKRFVAFCLGALQVCVGLLIMGASAGAAMPLGISLIKGGITDISNSLFNPDVLEDLKKYYSNRALEYTTTLALLGTSGLSSLIDIGKKGFEVIKNSSFSEIMKNAFSKMG